jgi:hypothetical protein
LKSRVEVVVPQEALISAIVGYSLLLEAVSLVAKLEGLTKELEPEGVIIPPVPPEEDSPVDPVEPVEPIDPVEPSPRS